MDRATGRPNHIEDYIIELHPNQWFGWTDRNNKIYSVYGSLQFLNFFRYLVKIYKY